MESIEENTVAGPEDFYKEIETYLSLCENFKLPDYLPIDSSTKAALVRIKPLEDERQNATLRRDLINYTEEYLMNNFSSTARVDPEDTLNTAFEGLQHLQDITKQNDDFDKTKKSMEEHFRHRMETEPEFYESLDYYLSNSASSTLYDIFKSTLKEVKDSSGAVYDDDDLLKLKQYTFVIKHPMEPLPGSLTGNRDDDDIEIAGGKIELVCPISREPFVNPYITPCGHTFSKESLTQTIGSAGKCPISGCDAVINIRKCEKDHLMELRVKSYEISKDAQELERRKNIETIA